MGDSAGATGFGLSLDAFDAGLPLTGEGLTLKGGDNGDFLGAPANTVVLDAVEAGEMPRPTVLSFGDFDGAWGGGICSASFVAFPSFCLFGNLMGGRLPGLNGPGDSCLANSAVESLTDIGAIESSTAGAGETLADRDGGVCWNLCSNKAPIASLLVVSFFGVSVLLSISGLGRGRVFIGNGDSAGRGGKLLP
jgi:hypothetical protein